MFNLEMFTAQIAQLSTRLMNQGYIVTVDEVKTISNGVTVASTRVTIKKPSKTSIFFVGVDKQGQAFYTIESVVLG